MSGGGFDPISFFFSIVVSWVAEEIVEEKQEKARAEAEARNAGTLVNKRSNIANLPVIYGHRKVGGTIVFTATSGFDNTYLYLVLALCDGEIEEIGDVYIDDVLSTDGRFNGLVTINKHLGSDTQEADSMLIDANIGWSDEHQGKGVAYIACRLKYDKKAFRTIPALHVMVKGKKVYDTRTDTTAYSSNPALCLRDYLTNTRYGKGLPASAIDDTLITVAANKCDTMVMPYVDGAVQKLFECNAVLNTGFTLMQNVRILLSGMRGIMPYGQKVYSLVVEDEAVGTPFAFNEGNIVGGISIRSERKSTKFNRCIVTFTNPDASWQNDEVAWPPAGSVEEAEYLAADGEELVKRLNLGSVTNAYTAEDIGEIVVRRSRDGKMVKLKATTDALQCAVPDIVAITHSTPGWDAKPFRILNISFANGEVTIEAIEHQDSIYPWAKKAKKDDVPDSNLPNPLLIGPPQGLAVDEELYQPSASQGMLTRALITWAASLDMFVSSYEVHYKLSSSSTWLSLPITTTTAVHIDNIVPAKYDFRIRAINDLPIQSEWSVTVTQTILGLSAIPADISGFHVNALGSMAQLNWIKSTDLDVTNGGHIEVRHSPLVEGTSWDNGKLLAKLAGSADNAALMLSTGTYMVKAVDSGGRYSADAINAVTTVPTVRNMNTVVNLNEHPDFTGTATNMIAVDNLLKLVSTDTWDDRLELMDDWEWLDGTEMESNGTYEVSQVLDLGKVYVSRITGKIDFTTSAINDTWDNRLNNMDDWASLDGTPSDKVKIELQVSATTDNPNSSPTWTDWQPLLTSDQKARAFRFRIVVENGEPNYNVYITNLTFTVDMEDRLESASAVTAPTTGIEIVFPNGAFKATPAVGITMNDAGSGDYWTITSQAADKFTVIFKDQSGAGVIRTFNWTANGYGQEAA